MARFDVYEFANPSVPFVVDVQADILSDLSTCAVIPLIPESKAGVEQLPRLKPIVQLNAKNFVLMTTDIGTVKRSDLGELVSNLEQEKQTITEAIDFLIQGF